MNTCAFAIIPGVGEWLVIAALVILPLALILVVIWFAKMTIANKRENMKLRLEVGKLANELEHVRKQHSPE
jgi:uncharacterized membrane protein